MKSIETETVIIGAGYAGIAAANELFKKGKEFIVLEARNRIGGRTNTKTLDCGATIDLGAQWIGPTHFKLWEWVKETGSETFNTYDEGKNILNYNGKTTKYSGTIPKIDFVSLIDLGWAIQKINNLCKEIDLEKPWAHPKAKRYDAITLKSWIDRNMFTKKGKHIFEVGIETVFAASSSELSFLHTLVYCASGDNMDTLISITKGAQQTMLINGTQNLLIKVAEDFADKIILNEAVLKIVQDGDKVEVNTNNLIIKAKKCIVTVPPALITNIKFEPVLPQMKAQLYQRIPMGAAMKCFVIYKSPFWRKQGWSGQIVSDKMPLKVTFDCSKDENDFGKILVFVEGQKARDFIGLPLEKRREMIIDQLAILFGDQAKAVLDYTDKCWTEEEFTRGCYAGYMPPGVITNFKNTIREPFMNVHFAGTETATKWNGYLEGAVLSGIRAVEEISL